MSRRISKLSTIHSYASSAADELEAIRDAVKRGASWAELPEHIRKHRRSNGDLRVRNSDPRWVYMQRVRLVNNLSRAQAALIETMEALQFEGEFEQDLRRLEAAKSANRCQTRSPGAYPGAYLNHKKARLAGVFKPRMDLPCCAWTSGNSLVRRGQVCQSGASARRPGSARRRPRSRSRRRCLRARPAGAAARRLRRRCPWPRPSRTRRRAVACLVPAHVSPHARRLPCR